MAQQLGNSCVGMHRFASRISAGRTVCISHPLARRPRASAQARCQEQRSSPVIVFDVMDTLVFDPFFTKMPEFFGMSFEALMKAKHPSAWLDFEKNKCTEAELFAKFFSDGRSFDSQGLMNTMVDSYRYLEGMEELLLRLKEAGYEMHVMSNYPSWFRLIEEKLAISKYMPWTFISCDGHMEGLRKPDPAAFELAVSVLGRPASDVIFVDDRVVNVDAAVALGMDGILFSGAAALEAVLVEKGLKF